MKKTNIETKKLLVRIPKDIYMKMRIISVNTEKSLNQYVVDAFSELVKKHEEDL
jgi:predicted HicB family RNase H-like nuclease